ncbi:unnamed protein product [Gordionus sp. m RMFG-2023]
MSYRKYVFNIRCTCMSQEILLSYHCWENACKFVNSCLRFDLCWNAKTLLEKKQKKFNRFKNNTSSANKKQGKKILAHNPFNCSCEKWGPKREVSCYIPPSNQDENSMQNKMPRDNKIGKYILYSLSFTMLMLVIGGSIFLIHFMLLQRKKKLETESITKEADKRRTEILMEASKNMYSDENLEGPKDELPTMSDIKKKRKLKQSCKSNPGEIMISKLIDSL